MNFDTIADAYGFYLRRLVDHAKAGSTGEFRDNDMVAEVIGAAFGIKDSHAVLLQSDARRFNYRYMTAECFWNVARRDDIGILRRYFHGIDQFVLDQALSTRHKATWAYGRFLNDQFAAMLKDIRQCPLTRRAAATTRVFWSNNPKLDGTPPCLTAVQWLLRDGKLTQITTMRSNDVWLGMPLDVYQFSMFQKMAAAELGVSPGMYFHQAGSLHLYKRDLPKAVAFLNADFEALEVPPLGDESLSAALRNSPLSLVEQYGHNIDDNVKIDYANATPGLEPYAALLVGDYHNTAAVFNTLREKGYGTGW